MVVMMFMRIMTRVVRIVIIYVSEVSRIIRDGLCHRPPQRCGAPCSLVALRRSTLQAMVICEHFRSIVASRGSEFAQAQHSARLCSSAPWRQCRRCWQRFLWQHHAVQRWLSFDLHEEAGVPVQQPMPRLQRLLLGHRQLQCTT